MAMSRKNGKSFSTILTSSIKKYFQGKYTTDASVFDELFTHLEGVAMSKEEKYYLSRILRLLFLGQLVGLHSLNAVLTRFGILSSREQTCYKKMCEKLSNNVFHQLFEFFLRRKFRRF